MIKKILFAMLAIISFHLRSQTNALNFNGSSSYIDIGTNAGNGVRTIEMLFRPAITIDQNMTKDAYTLIARNSSNEYGEFGLFFPGSAWGTQKAHLCFYLRNNNILYTIISDANSWQANTWYHVAATIDATDGMKLYIDGVLQSMEHHGGTNATNLRTEITTLGCWGDANIRHFEGDIDEVRLWNRAVSQTEINDKKCSTLNPLNETGLISYIPMEEGTGVTTKETINNSDLTLHNTAWLTSGNCMTTLEITSSDVNNSICNGESITFNATTNAGNSAVYQWQINGINTGNNQASFTTSSLQNNDVVTCIINPGNNQVTSNAIVTTVNALPNISISSSNGNPICNGSNTTLSATGGISYSWSNGSHNSNITVTPQSNTTYNVTGTDMNGCSTTVSTVINVSQVCPSIYTCNKTINDFYQAYITANTVAGATNYQFRFEEVNSAGAVIGTFYGTSTNYIMTLTNVTNPGILHFNAHYLTSVRVSTDNGVTWSPYGAKCNLYIQQPRNTPNNGYCGIHRNNLLSIYSVNPITYATQYKLRLTVSGTTNTFEYTLPVGQNSIVLQNIPGVVYNTNYNVEISSLVPYSYDSQTSTTVYGWSPYGTSCPFYMDMPANNPNNGYCGIHRNNLNLQYSVNTMGMSQQYKLRFRINGDNNPNNYIDYPMPMGATAVALSNIQGLAYNTIYTVEISSYVPLSYDFITNTYNYGWSTFGTPCLMYMDEPANNPSNGYCGIQRAYNGQYCANPISRATKYKFRLMVNGDPSNTYLPSQEFSYNGIGNLCFALNSTNIPGFQNNTHYKIEISTYVPYSYDMINQVYTYSNWSQWGQVCDLYVGNPAPGSRIGHFESTEDVFETSNELSIFPNPTNSYIEIKTDMNIQIVEILDVTGKSIMFEMIDKKIDFSKLSNGVYTMKVKTEDGVIIKKIVKQD